VPGDIVSFYATAHNAIATNRTDMFFIQAEPFERTFTQSQQMGGGGDADQMPPVSAHQKEITSATWNQIKNPPKDKTAEEENARVLSGVQSKLRDQAISLAGRMQVRDMSSANPAVKSFADDMAQAIEAMDQATAKLSARDWQGALPPEQKSLQHLSRAEATFRDIQVAISRGNGSGFGTGRDLEGMFDLELDREKNQYETGQNAASPEQKRKDMEEALAKLEELARRQQELAEQRRQNQQAYEQRWQQELLKREAEELRRKMEQMARSQSSALSRESQQGQQSDGQSGQQSPQAAAQSAAMNRAIERLKQAARDMENAGSPQNQGGQQSEAEARAAAERLREAREMLAGARKEQAAEEVKDFARRSEQLAQEQQEFENTVRHTANSGSQDPGQGQMSMRQPRNMRGVDQGGPLSAEQQKLLDELTKLEEDMQRSARDMSGSQPGASSKLREALGEMQQQELRLKMKWSLELMRRGMAEYALPREMPVTQGLNQLRDRLREAQSALNRQQPGQGQDVEAALARAEQLRRELEQMRSAAEGRQSQAKGGQQKGNQAGQKGQGQQPGQGQGQSQQGQGQQGQAPGDQPGQMAQGQGSQSGGNPQQGGGDSTGFQQGDGHAGPGAGEFWGRGVDSAYADRVIRNGVRDLTQAEQLLRGNQAVPRDTYRDVQDLIRQMQRLDPRLLAADPSRLSEIVGKLVDSVDQVELELRRVADSQQVGSVRSGAAQPVPPGYADAVAEYFRRLAAQK